MAERAAYREAHPLPAVIWHWINAVSFICLILSGFYIHYPLFGGFMSVARNVHIACGIIIVIGIIVRVVLSFIIKSAPNEGTRVVEMDAKNYFPQEYNKHQLGPFIKYYLFIKKDHPIGGKLNPMQKISYWLVFILILVMGYTGFCLWPVTQDAGIFQAGINLMGGLMSVRVIHYVLMFIFIIFILIHVYLGVTEGGGTSLIKLMFLRKEHEGYITDPKTGRIIGYDDLSTIRRVVVEDEVVSSAEIDAMLEEAAEAAGQEFDPEAEPVEVPDALIEQLAEEAEKAE